MTIRIQVPRRVRSWLPRDGTSATVTTAKSRTPLRLFFFFRHLVYGVEAGRTRWWSCGWEEKGWMERGVEDGDRGEGGEGSARSTSRPPGTVSIVVSLFFTLIQA